mgnify:FL=1
MSKRTGKTELTVEELKDMEGFQDLSEQECLVYLQQLKNVSLLFIKLYERSKQIQESEIE